MIHRPRRLAVVLGLNQTMSWGVTFYLPAVIADPSARSLGVPPVLVLGAFSWALLVTGFCAPRVGRWIDAHGGRGALSLSVVVLATGLVLLATAPDMAMWYVAWTVLGVGMALGLYDAAFATVGTLLGQEAGPIITGVTLIAGLASTVFWTLGAELLGVLGWRGLLLFYAALQLGVNLPMLRLFVPSSTPARQVERPRVGGMVGRSQRLTVLCLASFFTLRWFITSAIAAHVLPLLKGVGLTLDEAVFVAALIGPSQVAGRVLDWSVGGRLGVLLRARIGALLFPLGALVLLLGGPYAAAGFAVLYGMSNGILTINRGTLPLAFFGSAGYATLLGWLAVPVLLAQAAAPTLAAPLMSVLPSRDVLVLAGGVALLAASLLVPLRLPAERSP